MPLRARKSFRNVERITIPINNSSPFCVISLNVRLLKCKGCKSPNRDPFRKLVLMVLCAGPALHKPSAHMCACLCATLYVRCARWWTFDAQIQTCSNTTRRCCLLEIHYLAVKCFKSSENNSESLECSPGWRLLLSTPLTPAGLGLHSLSLICWSSALRPLTERDRERE